MTNPARGQGIPAYRNRRGEEVAVSSFTATVAKNEFGRILDAALRDGIVAITRHDEPKAVLLSFDEFYHLAGGQQRELDSLSGEFDALLARMQTPTARRGMKAAFGASPARMAKAALAASSGRGRARKRAPAIRQKLQERG
jgi:antitoxin Phd